MANNKKKKEKALKTKIYLGIAGGILVLIGVACAVIASKVQPKKVELNSDQEIAVSSLKIQIILDKLYGGGEITKQTCETFHALAKKYDKNTDWFRSSYCDYIIYADYNDTENTTTITLSDGTHAAIYTFDYDKEFLLDYKFIESNQKGRGITIETENSEV